MKYSFKKRKILKRPFPILIIKDFINKINQNKIIKEILNVKKKIDVEKVMGGRYQYSNHLFKKNESCNDIHDYFNKKETFEKILEFIDNDKNQFQIKDNQYKKFLKKTNFLHFLTKKFFPSLLKNSFFLEMDFFQAWHDLPRIQCALHDSACRRKFLYPKK